MARRAPAAGLRRPSSRRGAAKPGRSRRRPAAAAPSDQQGVAVLVPGAAGVVVAEHGGGLPRLLRQAERQVDLGQPVQRLGHVVGGLVILDHALEPADRRAVQLLALVEAADIHLLAGQMVAAEVDLQPRVAGIGGVGEAVHHVLQRGHGLFGAALVALRVGDLLVVAERAQVIGIGDVAMRRMQLDEAVQRADRLGVAVAHGTRHRPPSAWRWSPRWNRGGRARPGRTARPRLDSAGPAGPRCRRRRGPPGEASTVAFAARRAPSGVACWPSQARAQEQPGSASERQAEGEQARSGKRADASCGPVESRWPAL